VTFSGPSVVVVDLKIRFWSIVWLVLKFWIATLVAALIVLAVVLGIGWLGYQLPDPR
jgi:hypothetical protein